jgi:hypothetical protein
MDVTNEYLVCRFCGLLSPISSAALEQSLDTEISELDRFRAEHDAHGLEVAMRSDAAAVHDRPVWDPMAISWFEVRINDELFVVRSSRTTIENPRTWELLSGVIEHSAGEVELDQEYLRLALDEWFYPQVLPPRVSDRFLAVLEDITQAIDPDEITEAFDDSDDPQVSIAPLPISARERVLERTQAFLDDIERQRFAGFVDAHSGADGALALHVRRPFVVRSR